MRFLLFIYVILGLSFSVSAQTLPPFLDDLVTPFSDAPSFSDAPPFSDANELTQPLPAVPSVDKLSELDKLYDALARAKEPAAAAAAARSIQKLWIASGSPTVDLLMARANQAVMAGNFPLALDLLEPVLTMKPDFAEGWNRRAAVFYLREDYGRALADIERVLALEPRHWGALSGLAGILRRLDRDAQALTVFREILKIYPLQDGARKAVEALEEKNKGDAI